MSASSLFSKLHALLSTFLLLMSTILAFLLRRRTLELRALKHHIALKRAAEQPPVLRGRRWHRRHGVYPIHSDSFTRSASDAGECKVARSGRPGAPPSGTSAPELACACE